jgi:hypothetical protein
MGGDDVRACGRVRRRCRWWVGVSRFRVARERVARGNVGMGANVGTRPWDRRSQRGTVVHARSAARPTRPSARRRAWARTDAVQIRVSLFKRDFLQFFQLKWPKVWIPKLCTTLPSTTFTKGVWPFSKPFVQNSYAKLQISWALVNSVEERWPSFFTHFHSKSQMPLNMKVVFYEKLHNFRIGRIWSV